MRNKTILVNFLTGIHRYAYKSGEPGQVLDIVVRNVEMPDGKSGFLRTVFEVEYEDKTVDHIPMESILAGHYIITPFKPTAEEIENFRSKADRISPEEYSKFIIEHSKFIIKHGS